MLTFPGTVAVFADDFLVISELLPTMGTVVIAFEFNQFAHWMLIPTEVAGSIHDLSSRMQYSLGWRKEPSGVIWW